MHAIRLKKKPFDSLVKKIRCQINKFVGADDKSENISFEDCEFLEEIARRELIDHHYKESSSMFQFIITLNPFFNGAWVGWAISEQELEHMDVVDNIYQIAGELLPYDSYIALFAADFYIMINQKEKAVTFLDRTKEQLINENMRDSNSFHEIEEKLLDKAVSIRSIL